MLIQRRLTEARTAGAVLTAIGLVLMLNGALVGPAGASGEYTTVELTSPVDSDGATYAWDYAFHQNGGHGLSNIAVRFCGDILSHVMESDDYEIFTDGDVPGGHTGFGPGIKFAYTAATGSLTVLFDQVFPVDPAGIQLQSHSGDGQDGDLVVSGPGPGPCVTPTTVAPTTVAPTTLPPTTLPPTTLAPTTTVPETTTTVPETTTVVPTTTVDATTVPFARVLGETLRADTAASTPAVVAAAELAKTGSNWVPLLTWAGLALILMGINVMLIDYVRQRRTNA
ncbi:MAG TPA: hypothetical protein VM121_06615 [Acidimicrobiales bacterium]|nr:hypothetical protein [Acidimicrobiales bacterium]